MTSGDEEDPTAALIMTLPKNPIFNTRKEPKKLIKKSDAMSARVNFLPRPSATWLDAQQKWSNENVISECLIVGCRESLNVLMETANLLSSALLQIVKMVYCALLF